MILNTSFGCKASLKSPGLYFVCFQRGVLIPPGKIVQTFIPLSYNSLFNAEPIP